MSGVIRVRGAGVVCALGVGAAAVHAAIEGGRTLDGFHPPSPDRATYPAPFEALRDLPAGKGARLGRQLAMALAAALEAVAAAGASSEDPTETGVVAATAHGPIHETVDFITGAVRHGARYASPLSFSGAQHNAMVGVVARELGIRGHAMVVSNGEVSFETALLAATAGLRAGRMRRVLVVGSDSFHEAYAASLDLFGLLTPRPRPLDPRMREAARGFHLGEGAGALVLERVSEDHAGVGLDHVALGAAARDVPRGASHVQVLASGDVRSVRGHDAALAAVGAGSADVAYPAVRYGAFASLSAVAIAVEASRRLHSEEETGTTLFLSVPRDACEATVVLSGGGVG